MTEVLNDLVWWTGAITIFLVVSIVSLVLFAPLLCWATSAYGIWKGYILGHERFPDANIVSPEFRAQYGRLWKLVLLGALLSQYDRIMTESGGVFKTQWFEVDLRKLRPTVHLK